MKAPSAYRHNHANSVLDGQGRIHPNEAAFEKAIQSCTLEDSPRSWVGFRVPLYPIHQISPGLEREEVLSFELVAAHRTFLLSELVDSAEPSAQKLLKWLPLKLLPSTTVSLFHRLGCRTLASQNQVDKIRWAPDAATRPCCIVF